MVTVRRNRVSGIFYLRSARNRNRDKWSHLAECVPSINGAGCGCSIHWFKMASVKETPWFLEILRKDGFYVMPDVIPKKLLEETYLDFMRYLVDVTNHMKLENRLDRKLEKMGHEKKTVPVLPLREMVNQFNPLHGILQFPPELSHAYFVKRIREHPNVAEVFRAIYGADEDEEIVFSFDRVNFQLSLTDKNSKYKKIDDWWHVDQRSAKRGFHCIQGYIDILGSEGDEDPCLQVIDRSHLKFAAFAERFPPWKTDWRKFDEDELNDVIPGWRDRVINVKAKAGSLVLWDSRMIHQSKRNTAEVSYPKEYLGYQQKYYPGSINRRLVIYSCGWPVSKLSEHAMTKRELFKDQLLTSSHWPDCRKKLTVGRTFGLVLDPVIRERTKLWLEKYPMSAEVPVKKPFDYDALLALDVKKVIEIVDTEESSQASVDDSEETETLEMGTVTSVEDYVLPIPKFQFSFLDAVKMQQKLDPVQMKQKLKRMLSSDDDDDEDDEDDEDYVPPPKRLKSSPSHSRLMTPTKIKEDDEEEEDLLWEAQYSPDPRLNDFNFDFDL